MSGGRFNYANDNAKSEIFGYFCDYDENRLVRYCSVGAERKKP